MEPQIENAQVNWQSQLLPNEVGEDGGVRFVYLKGLRRLARIRGIESESHPLVSVAMWETRKQGTVPFVQVSYTVTYKDGSTYSDVADAHYFNVGDPNFAIYPTAIAASRAEARCLKKSLGIDLVSKEELAGNKNAGYDMTGSARPEQVNGLRILMKRLKIKDESIIIAASVSSERKDEVYSLEELTFSEAQKAMKWLNGQAGETSNE